MPPRIRDIANRLGIDLATQLARGLCVHEEATNLVIADHDRNGREFLLIAAAADAWRKLKDAAIADGISMSPVSAFRSIERQAELVQRKLNAGALIDTVLTELAPPGFSEHHTGRAVDISAPGIKSLATEFDRTPAFAWLVRHAGNFGYHLSYPAGNAQGYQYEPWHWCFHDVPSNTS